MQQRHAPSSRLSVLAVRRLDADPRPLREIVANHPPIEVSDLSAYRRGSKTFGPKRAALLETLFAVEYGLTSGVVEAK